MIRMADFGPENKLACPYCGATGFHYPVERCEATNWMASLVGMNTLPERVELTCLDCGGVSYALPSDMVTMKRTIRER